MSWSFRSPAKINPHLTVVGRRNDGFHELKLLFQTIDLHDLLHFERAGSGFLLESLRVDDSLHGVELAAGEDNLVVRAGRAFARHWPLSGGIRVRVEKSIPIGGGLGGGSSNAATTLLALRTIFGQPMTVAELWPVARELGADVPFFLLGGLAAGFGRGEELLPIEDGPEEELILAQPRASVSTASVFAEFSRRAAESRPESMTGSTWPRTLVRWALEGRNAESLRQLDGSNDLEAGVRASCEPVSAVYAALHRQGVEGVRMTGSGACLFGFPPRVGSDLPVLPPELGSIRRVRTLSRRSLAEFRGAS